MTWAQILTGLGAPSPLVPGGDDEPHPAALYRLQEVSGGIVDCGSFADTAAGSVLQEAEILMPGGIRVTIKWPDISTGDE